MNIPCGASYDKPCVNLQIGFQLNIGSSLALQYRSVLSLAGFVRLVAYKVSSAFLLIKTWPIFIVGAEGGGVRQQLKRWVFFHAPHPLYTEDTL